VRWARREFDRKAVYVVDVAYPREEKPMRFGPWLTDTAVGVGNDGRCSHAVHVDTGEQALVKYPSRGDSVLLWMVQAYGLEWPDELVQTIDTGYCEPIAPLVPWIGRQWATHTLHSVMPLDRAEALEVFSIACRGVSWLHSHRMYGWSAHCLNIFSVGGTWKIGDFGRVKAFLPPECPQVAECAHIDTGHPTRTGFYGYDVERERRLRLQDCASLGGLLCDLLTGKRWEWFFRALNKKPYCSAHLPVTGDRDVDEQLSGILNRAWRGDAGGALLAANDGRGEQSVYDEPIELLRDVEAALGLLTG
jgi:hypothetical protein